MSAPKNPAVTLFACGALGLAMGFGLSRIGFADWGQVNAMFTLSDLRLYFVFGGGVAILAVFYAVAGRGKELPRRQFHPGIIPGSILFGAGWALTSACPTIVLVQIGEGQLPAFVSLLGIAIGIRLYRIVHTKLFHWDTGSCET